MQRAFIVDVTDRPLLSAALNGGIMENKKLIMKCCICGRVKTEDGWEYQFRERENEDLCSHGFCTVCYEAEIMKIRIETVAPAVALAY
jgi:hypothetical protein